MKQAEKNTERGKKPSSKRIEHKGNWDIGIPQLNHPAYISIYIDVRRRRKTERLPLEAKIKAETVEHEDEIVSETIEQKLKQVGKQKELNLKMNSISCKREKHSGLTKGVI